jgi:hypothetical protein
MRCGLTTIRLANKTCKHCNLPQSNMDYEGVAEYKNRMDCSIAANHDTRTILHLLGCRIAQPNILILLSRPSHLIEKLPLTNARLGLVFPLHVNQMDKVEFK